MSGCTSLPGCISLLCLLGPFRVGCSWADARTALRGRALKITSCAGMRQAASRGDDFGFCRCGWSDFTFSCRVLAVALGCGAFGKMLPPGDGELILRLDGGWEFATCALSPRASLASLPHPPFRASLSFPFGLNLGEVAVFSVLNRRPYSESDDLSLNGVFWREDFRKICVGKCVVYAIVVYYGFSRFLFWFGFLLAIDY